MDEMISTIQKLSEIVRSCKLEHPNDAVFRVMLLNLEELQSELHKSNPDKEKVDQIHYGILRAYQDLMSDIENRDFHEETKKLLLELNNF